MSELTEKLDFAECVSVDIGAYVDGELDPSSASLVEHHVDACRACLDELNLQKRFLATLDGELRTQIEVPADFAKTVMANAEGRVEGLRQGRERLNAAFIIAALSLFVLFAMGRDARSGIAAITAIADQAAAVAGIALTAVYDFFVGVVVVLRTLASPVEGAFVLTLAAGILVLAAMSRSFNRLSRS